MAYAAALARTTAEITAIVADSFGNGTDYVNNAVPSTSHVPAIAMWPKVAGAAAADPATFEGLEAAIALYTRTDVDAAARTALAVEARMDIETGVVVAIARASFVRLYNLAPAQVSAAESVTRPNGDAALTVHAEHRNAVALALEKWSAPGARCLGLAFYNSVSVETSAHHHLPAKTKRLWTTTRDLLRLKEWLDAEAGRESHVAHNTFHPLSDTVKSELARSSKSQKVLSNLKLGNLAKRIPVKAADTGLALNYTALAAKAFGYAHTPVQLPADLKAPAGLIAAVAAYVEAADEGALATAVGTLQRISGAMEEPSAYLAGFILGKDARSTDNPDLTLDEAKQQNTILGSPAYKRAAAEFPGTFAEGKARGWAKLSKWAESAATDALAPTLAGTVANLGLGGAPAANAMGRAAAERVAHREAEAVAVAAAAAAAVLGA